MQLASAQTQIANLSTVLLSNLDELFFFSKISEHIYHFCLSVDRRAHERVIIYEVLSGGEMKAIVENGQALENQKALQKGQGITGYVVRTKRAYYSNSIKRDPIASNGTLLNNDIESELCVPILVEGTVIATVNIQSSDQSRKFSEDDIRAINEIISGLKSPLKNMHLYLMAKNLNKELLAQIESQEKELNNKTFSKTYQGLDSSLSMIGVSKVFINLVQMCKKVAAQDFPILLEGQHGVGKKILAKKIHSWSEREGACILASCTSMTDEQLNADLFSSRGLLIQANGGTLIIDDISNLGEILQKKLLRFIVTGELITTDSNEKKQLNVRLIVTSKQSLKERVQEGLLLEDLYYRLSTVYFNIPSLKERRDDIRGLAEFFLNHNKKEKKIVTSEALEKLSAYHWPGNAHELKNVMERIYILTDGQYIEASHLPQFEQEEKAEVEQEVVIFNESTLFDLEKRHILDTLSHLDGNKTRAAKALGITVKTLYNKLHNYGLIEAKEQQ